MIRPIDIRLNAAHPELPLAEAVTFTGAPSTVLIRGVPPNCGRWAITAVFVAATFPDGSTTTRAAVQSANGVWVATLPATARSGRTENGLRVMADGIDENGAAVTGYILGVADFAVASLAVTPAPEPGETSWQMLYFDAVPGTLRKGDVAKVDGVLKLYNGTAWEAFAGDIPAPSTATPAMDGTGAAGTSAAFARGDHVHPTDTSRMAASATGADIAVSGTDATKIDAALAGKASKSDVDPLLFAQYYPDGSVKSTTEFTQGIKYNAPDTVNRTITVKPFCNTGNTENDNSSLVGRVVIPPFVDSSGNGYISDDGTRYKVVGVGNGGYRDDNTNLTAIIAPSTVTTIEDSVFHECTSLTSVSLPAVTTIEGGAFYYCDTLTSISLPAATTIGSEAFAFCSALTSVSLPAATTIESGAFYYCDTLSSVDFGDTPRSDVPILGMDAFNGVPPSCKIIVPYTQYDEWKAADGWRDLQQEFVRHAEKADKPATFTTGNLAALDADGNPTDSALPAANVAVKGNIPYDRITITTGQLQDHAVQKVTLNAATTTLTLPALTDLTGKVSDFGIDMVNGHAPSGTPTAASFTLDGTLGSDYNLIVPEGEDWSEMSALAAGEMAVYYFTLSAFQINDKPTWEVMKKVVTLVPVPSAP